MKLNKLFENTKEIENALLGTIFADGSLNKQVTPNGRASCEITHTSKNLDYLQFKKELFELLPECKCTIKPHNKKAKQKTYLLYRLATNRTDWLTSVRNDIYEIKDNKRVKHLPKDYIDRFNIISFLLLYLDDGCLRVKYKKNGEPSQFRMTLCLESFPKEELEYLIQWINKTFDVEFHMYHHYKYEEHPELGWRPWISTKGTMKIMEKLNQFYDLIPSMQYKFPKYYLL